jgi:N4-(beta-N-acetylglucosaminyl)-L-asparaginase
MAIGVSTSGLFMKRSGRVGDSPIIGSGFYVDSLVGGAAATGVGEDIMKGCLSYETVRLMKEGMNPQQACERALSNHNDTLIIKKGNTGSMSIIAMNSNGEWGVATNKAEFSFIIGTSKEDIKVYLAKNIDGELLIEKASEEWLEKYNKDLAKGSGV